MTDTTADTTETAVPQKWPSPVYAWYVMVVMIIAYTFAILDRSIISLLVVPIKEDLGVTDSQIGLLQGLAFAICYTTFGLVLGFVTDRTDRRLLLAGGIFVWSLATVACGLSNTFEMLFISRIFVGLGEACVLPCSGSLIADYLPPKQRAKAFGLLLLGGTLGTSVGSLIGGAAAPIGDITRAFDIGWLSALENWQIVFLVVGFPGILVAALFALTVREPERREKKDVQPAFSLKPLIAHVGQNKLSYFCLLGATVLNVTCIYAQISWLPTFLMRVIQMPAEQAGVYNAALGIFGATSAVTVGWGMAWLLGKKRDDAPLICALIHACSLLFLGCAAFLAPTFLLFAIPMVMKSFFSNWSTSAALMGLSQITPNELRGQVTAFYTLLTGLVSLTLGAWSVGFLSDTVFTDTEGIRYSLAVVFGVAGALSILLVIIGRPAFRASAKRALAWAEPE